MTPLIYLAGPITKPNPMHNSHEAFRLAHRIHEVFNSRVMVHVPHATVLQDMVAPRHYEHWMAHDLVVIEHCDGLYRMRGESPGADREVEHAHTIGKPVFHDFDDLRVFLALWGKQQ